MKKKVLLISILAFMLILSTGAGVYSKNVSQSTEKQRNTANLGSPYQGTLKIFIVEPTSRWDNFDGDPYHFGFLDFALNEDLSIEYQDTYQKDVTWNAYSAGFDSVTENNVMVIAAVYNPQINKAYAYPPFQNPFNAHYVDAAAGAEPGETGQNEVTEDFTHTVFIEEATAQYCQYCPAMAEALNDIYNSDDYPFYFVALVTKDRQGNTINPVAFDYLLNVYNLAAYPSAFFDGGRKVVVGGYDDESYYRPKIEQCGRRDVHELDLSLSVEWLGAGDIEIQVSITNNEEIINNPPDKPTIQGESTGNIREEQEFSISTTDPEGDDVYYWVEFCEDCQDAEWNGPYSSGEDFIISHTWTAQGSYTVRVKAKDSNGAESEWETFDVTMPRQRNIKISGILERILKFFPILNFLT